MKKLVCVSRIDDFVLPHLPNRYVGTYGIGHDDFKKQLDALIAIAANQHPVSSVATVETRVELLRWSKSYYENSRDDILSVLVGSRLKILSYGCGIGNVEARLVEAGHDVTAVPLDSVIANCVSARGIRTVLWDEHSGTARLPRDHFDYIVVTDLLHLQREPESLVAALAALVRPGGSLVVTAPNMSQVTTRWRMFRRRPGYARLGSYVRSGMHMTSKRLLRRWLKNAGLAVERIAPVFPRRVRRLGIAIGAPGEGLLAEELIAIARKLG
jgi:2-polyprenyl-3-methyl-5-hydroxy-6-metoxy-1,4-benzoquinol methylase